MIIGVYDSGLGGLSVWRELQKRLPAQFIYFGDTAHLPYGEKTAAELLGYYESVLHFLQSRRIELLVLACNTLSALVLPEVQKKAPLPVMGIIEAALAALLPVSKGRVGLLATEATVQSGVYSQALQKTRPAWRLFSQAAPRLTTLVEEGRLEGPQVQAVLQTYLAPLKAKRIDTLLLGCTHYAFLGPAILKVLGAGITLVDPASVLAERVQKRFPGIPPSSSGPNEFWVSAQPGRFQQTAAKLLGGPIPQVRLHQLPGVKA